MPGVAPAAGGSLPDQIANFLRIVFVHERSYTMFTALFGYGMVLIAGKLSRSGHDRRQSLRLPRRRGRLLLFGFLHGALVFSGEILGTYGPAAVLLAGLMLSDDRRLNRSIALITALQGSCWRGCGPSRTPAARSAVSRPGPARAATWNRCSPGPPSTP